MYGIVYTIVRTSQSHIWPYDFLLLFFFLLKFSCLPLFAPHSKEMYEMLNICHSGQSKWLKDVRKEIQCHLLIL